MILAAIFDIDGVLLDSKQANAAYYRAFLARHGYPPVSESKLEYGHSHTLRESIAYFTGAPDRVVDELWEQSRDLAGYPYKLARLPEHCEATLEALSKRYALGVMSSRIIAGIEQFLDLSGTHNCFSTIIGYEDTSEHKPSPAPLLLACERLSVEPSSAVYVGDASSDLACACAAGAHFIAYGDAVPEAEHAVTCFADLNGAIERLAP
jgi:phosphoglycolate phosphatase